ncbi:MAG: hypothetical protein ABI877_06325, partial [Gemmatimonadaceae bacterium]
LALIVDDVVEEFVSAWMPRHVTLAPVASTSGTSSRPALGAAIRVRKAAALEDRAQAWGRRSRGAPVIATFGPVSIRPIPDGLALDAGRAGARGVVHYATLDAELEIGAVAPPDVIAVHAMLTVATAALLGRLGRALVHAAAVVAPDGGAWLLAGDSHAGKSTTCATLLEAGWRYCSDDHVVVSAAPSSAVQVEGWPRVLHLDNGWDGGIPEGGLRASVDSFERWPGVWLASAPVMGVLLPMVHPREATRLLPCTAATRLSALIRQSPWLFADARAAPRVLALLRRIALLPGAVLQLGDDSFHQPLRLRDALAPLTGEVPTEHRDPDSLS